MAISWQQISGQNVGSPTDSMRNALGALSSAGNIFDSIAKQQYLNEQNAIANAYKEKQLAQAAEQFDTTMGLKRDTLDETIRSNQAMEAYRTDSLNETMRSNRVKESLSRDKLAEERRMNDVNIRLAESKAQEKHMEQFSDQALMGLVGEASKQAGLDVQGQQAFVMDRAVKLGIPIGKVNDFIKGYYRNQEEQEKRAYEQDTSLRNARTKDDEAFTKYLGTLNSTFGSGDRDYAVALRDVIAKRHPELARTGRLSEAVTEYIQTKYGHTSTLWGDGTKINSTLPISADDINLDEDTPANRNLVAFASRAGDENGTRQYNSNNNADKEPSRVPSSTPNLTSTEYSRLRASEFEDRLNNVDIENLDSDSRKRLEADINKEKNKALDKITDKEVLERASQLALQGTYGKSFEDLPKDKQEMFKRRARQFLEKAASSPFDRLTKRNTDAEAKQRNIEMLMGSGLLF